MARSNHLLLTLYGIEDNLMDIIDEVDKPHQYLAVSTKAGKLPASQAKEIKKHFVDGYASRASLTKLIWVYIKDNDLNEGKEITLDPLLKKLAGNKQSKINMMKLPSILSKGIDSDDVIKVS